MSQLMRDIYYMSLNRGQQSNYWLINGRISGIGFQGGFEDKKSCGKSFKISHFFTVDILNVECILQESMPGIQISVGIKKNWTSNFIQIFTIITKHHVKELRAFHICI
jgi:hypothetical protein